MATDFFTRQDQARQKTFYLVLWFTLAVIALITVAYFVVEIALYAQQSSKDRANFSWWNPTLFVGTTALLGTLVLGGSTFKILELASGGSAVALMLGGKEIPTNTQETKERRLLNIVEEMAIASGVPVPPCYILPEEKGINAFAAGYANGDAIVAVSQGCLDFLSRDELQGVVAHEFSHILNGDMRMNIRLIGVIYGILMISIIGEIAMRSIRHSSSSDKNDGRFVVFLVGIALYILGLGGVFFGNIIQAAISRQREYLADASAVQFTRNPEGIAGALKKIGGFHYGANIRNGNAAEVAHMFFADGLVTHLGRLFATHPPLEERIRLLDPHWNGTYPDVKRVEVSLNEEKIAHTRKPGGMIPGLPVLPGTRQIPAPMVLGLAEDGIQKIGTVTPEMADQAAAILEELPYQLRLALAEPYAARLVIFALLLDERNPTMREQQRALILRDLTRSERAEFSRLEQEKQALSADHRLPVVNIAVPALRQLSPAQYRQFRQQVQTLIDMDQQLDAFERGVVDLLTTHLDRAFGLARKEKVIHQSALTLATKAAKVISSLAWAGKEGEDVDRAFKLGMQAFLEVADAPYTLTDRANLRPLKESLESFRQSNGVIKRKLVRACLVAILADGKIVMEELERVRLVAALLEVPLPPLHLGPQTHTADSILIGKM